MSIPSGGPTARDIANRLTVHLLLIGLVAALLNGVAVLATRPFGPFAVIFVAVANVPVLWLVVHAAFDALEALLELKLDERL